MRNRVRALACLVGLLCLAEPAAAKVIKFEVVKTESPAFEGRVFGSVGTYDRIVARATIAVAPGDPHNSIIVDLDRAPQNAGGLVEVLQQLAPELETVPIRNKEVIQPIGQQAEHVYFPHSGMGSIVIHMKGG